MAKDFIIGAPPAPAEPADQIPDNPPAFPFVVMEQSVTGAVRQVATPGMSLLDYHLAHAPAVPDWYREQCLQDDPKPNDMEILIGWRYSYAVNVIRNRPIFQ